MPVQNENITLLHLLTHPIRYRIVKELEKGDPLYISELSDRLKVDRKVVSFHLMTLRENDLAETYLETKSPAKGNPVVVRYAKLSGKAKSILSQFKL